MNESLAWLNTGRDCPRTDGHRWTRLRGEKGRLARRALASPQPGCASPWPAAASRLPACPRWAVCPPSVGAAASLPGTPRPVPPLGAARQAYLSRRRTCSGQQCLVVGGARRRGPRWLRCTAPLPRHEARAPACGARHQLPPPAAASPARCTAVRIGRSVGAEPAAARAQVSARPPASPSEVGAKAGLTQLVWLILPRTRRPLSETR